MLKFGILSRNVSRKPQQVISNVTKQQNQHNQTVLNNNEMLGNATIYKQCMLTTTNQTSYVDKFSEEKKNIK